MDGAGGCAPKKGMVGVKGYERENAKERDGGPVGTQGWTGAPHMAKKERPVGERKRCKAIYTTTPRQSTK